MGQEQAEDPLVVVKPTRQSALQPLLKPLPMDTWLDDYMDEQILGGRTQATWGKPRDYFRPSGAADMCFRSVSINALGRGRLFEARTLRIFRMGNKVEEGVKTDLAEIMVHGDYPVELAYPPFKGRLDLVITHEGEEFVGEIKSINRNRFDRLPRPLGSPEANVVLLTNAERGAICQWTVYAQGYGQKRGFILYECKDNSNRKIYWVVYSDALAGEIFEVHASALDYVKRFEVAPVPIDRRPQVGSDPICKWCDARALCVALGRDSAPLERARKLDEEIASEAGPKR